MIERCERWLKKGVVILALLSLNGNASAQFLHMELDIDNEIEADLDQNLDFGTLSVGSGSHIIQFGDNNMGVLRINTIENQTLIVSTVKPNALTYSVNNSHHIPIKIAMRYGYDKNRPGNSLQLINNKTIHIEKDSTEGIWRNLYLFMYGSLEIGEVPSGIYSEDLIINIDYI